MRALLLSYFTQPVHVLPQSQPQFYKFNIGETVRMDVLPNERKSLAFKYSLNPGNILNPFTPKKKSCSDFYQNFTTY